MVRWDLESPPSVAKILPPAFASRTLRNCGTHRGTAANGRHTRWGPTRRVGTSRRRRPGPRPNLGRTPGTRPCGGSRHRGGRPGRVGRGHGSPRLIRSKSRKLIGSRNDVLKPELASDLLASGMISKSHAFGSDIAPAYIGPDHKYRITYHRMLLLIVGSGFGSTDFTERKDCIVYALLEMDVGAEIRTRFWHSTVRTNWISTLASIYKHECETPRIDILPLEQFK